MPTAQVWPSNPRLACTGGELAQLVERCDRTAEVRGSNPLFSTAFFAGKALRHAATATLVTLTVMTRPEAFVTFAILVLAAGFVEPKHRRRTVSTPCGKREQ